MKINKTLMIFLLLIVTSIFCVAPVFIQLNISDDPLKIILSFIRALPMYYILALLRNKICYTRNMNYETSKQLTDARFKRLVGVERTTFKEMLNVLRVAYQTKHSKGGRRPKMSLEDILMATLQYLREYRTYEQIAADFDFNSVLAIEPNRKVYNVHLPDCLST